jgi:heme A synthase
LLAYTILVILWGAFVRATGSGAGCGSHWPTCQGDLVHRPQSIETVIELAHRLSSGLYGFLVLGLTIAAFRIYPKGHLVRTGAVLTLVFTITESLLGAGLVLFEWVAYNVSLGRVVAAAIHLLNTFLLLGAATLTYWWATEQGGVSHGGKPIRWRQQGQTGWLLGIGLLAMLILSAAGAITALGDTIFPVDTLLQGIQQDLDPTSHFLIRLRIWHPIIAIATSFFLLFASGLIVAERPSPQISRFSRIVRNIVILQLVAGFINVALLAPVWMQIVHLLLADSLWVALVLLAANTLSETAVIPQTK